MGMMISRTANIAGIGADDIVDCYADVCSVASSDALKVFSIGIDDEGEELECSSGFSVQLSTGDQDAMTSCSAVGGDVAYNGNNTMCTAWMCPRRRLLSQYHITFARDGRCGGTVVPSVGRPALNTTRRTCEFMNGDHSGVGEDSDVIQCALSVCSGGSGPISVVGHGHCPPTSPVVGSGSITVRQSTCAIYFRAMDDVPDSSSSDDPWISCPIDFCDTAAVPLMSIVPNQHSCTDAARIQLPTVSQSDCEIMQDTTGLKLTLATTPSDMEKSANASTVMCDVYMCPDASTSPSQRRQFAFGGLCDGNSQPIALSHLKMQKKTCDALHGVTSAAVAKALPSEMVPCAIAWGGVGAGVAAFGR
jgi:hypothetical protein